MKRKVYAVSPYLRESGNNFKMFPYYAWEKVGGMVAEAHYPLRCLHGFAYKFTYPRVWTSKKEARLRFVEVNSLQFDAFPDYMFYEIIPFIWDCWPMYDEKLICWLKRYNVKSCVFTSRQAAERIKEALPYLNILIITEGLDVKRYAPGKELTERAIDLYTFGRIKEQLINVQLPNVVEKRNGSDEELFERLQDAKVTIALPQCDVLPERTGGQETLTQRFWECMLSRMVMIGRAPQELTDYIGYNPVVTIDYENYHEQLLGILTHIDDYQSLVDKNRETALKMAPWELRMKQVMEWLESQGYSV